MKGQEFADLIKYRGTTQAEIAEKCRVTPQAVQKWSRRKDEPVDIPKKHQIKVANILGVPVSEFGPVGLESTLISADNNSVAQQSGRDSTVTQGHMVSSTPIKAQLIYLIEKVATDDYCRRQIKVLQEAERLMSGK